MSSLDATKAVLAWATTKLQGEWTSPSICGQIDAGKLRLLLTVFRKLEAMMKVW